MFAIVLIPVAIGMLVRWRWPNFANALDKPVRIASIIILVIVIVGAVIANREAFFANFGALALMTISFCVIRLLVGYFVPRLFRVERSQAIASSFEIGIHNATLAIVIAQTVLGVFEMSLPAAVYGVLMFFIAASFGFAIRGRRVKAEEPVESHRGGRTRRMPRHGAAYGERPQPRQRASLSTAAAYSHGARGASGTMPPRSGEDAAATSPDVSTRKSRVTFRHAAG